jgi:hypothetical protein
MLKKIQSALSMVEIAESNLKNLRQNLLQILEENGQKANYSTLPAHKSRDEQTVATEVVEGNFDGENMVGDNGQVYLVPQNYASKSQLVIGDRMKWLLTSDREIYKLIAPVERERVSGIFSMDGDNYAVIVENIKNPVRILKASATFAIKNQGLSVGDEVVILIPKNATPTWGALVSVVKKNKVEVETLDILPKSVKQDFVKTPYSTEELDSLPEFGVSKKTSEDSDYF